MDSAKEFIDMTKNDIVPNAYKMIVFDTSSLFTMVPLDHTIHRTLKQIYSVKKLKTRSVINMHQERSFHFWKEHLLTKRWYYH